VFGFLYASGTYGFTNPKEFIAEFIANENFRDMLKNIPAIQNSKF
jgi:hypothetical protein